MSSTRPPDTPVPGIPCMAAPPLSVTKTGGPVYNVHTGPPSFSVWQARQALQTTQSSGFSSEQEIAA